jgi:hypothetical protein
MPMKKISILKLVQPKAKLGLQGTSEIELVFVKLIGVSKKLCLLDLPGSSHGPRDKDHVVTKVDERAACVMAFDNLGDDSSLDIRGSPSLRVTE